MKIDEVRKRLGSEESWKKFDEWMHGQTIGTYPDGSINIHECDVEAFERMLRTGYDRQKDPIAWD